MLAVRRTRSSVLLGRRLVRVYDSWSQANATNQTCWDSNACIDVRASCVNATRFIADRYCKCPEGYRADETNMRCGQ